jgi:DnaK suppressor protein
MSPKQLEFFRQRLLGWQRELLEESQNTIDEMRNAARDVSDEAERASREAEISFELRTRDRYRKLLSKIDQALHRIEDGSYGYCEETGEPIGLERLEARPVATLSIEAQQRRERLERQYSDRF